MKVAFTTDFKSLGGKEFNFQVTYYDALRWEKQK